MKTENQLFLFRVCQCWAVKDAKDLDDLKGEDAGQDDVEEALEDHEDPVDNVNTLEGSNNLANYYYDWK